MVNQGIIFHLLYDQWKDFNDKNDGKTDSIKCLQFLYPYINCGRSMSSTFTYILRLIIGFHVGKYTNRSSHGISHRSIGSWRQPTTEPQRYAPVLIHLLWTRPCQGDLLDQGWSFCCLTMSRDVDVYFCWVISLLAIYIFIYIIFEMRYEKKPWLFREFRWFYYSVI